MKKIYFLFLAVCLFTAVNAQIINIPDANFKTKLLEAKSYNYIAKDANGNYIKIDTNNNNEIEVSEALAIYDLYIYNSEISDLTGITFFTNLTSLNCNQNQISSLDLTGLSNLTLLNCSSNQISSLDLTGLSNLSILYCYLSQISSLDLTGLSNLTYLNCSENQISSLDLTGLRNLNGLDCYSNQISSLDLTGLSNLSTVGCSSNQISSLDLTGLSNLKTLWCSENQISTLDLTGLSNFTNLNCSENKISSLDLTGLSNLDYLDCHSTQISFLDLTGLSSLTYLDCQSSQISSLDLTGLSNLKTLYCQSNQISSLDLTGLSNLDNLDCSSNQISFLDLTGLSSLAYLDCQSNQILSLDLTGLSNLNDFDCSSNQISSLDLTGLSKLWSLICYSNQITSIDFSGSSNLVGLYCGQNPIESVDFAKMPNLESLWCGYTPISTLDLSSLKKLTGVNVSNCPNLEFISLKNGSVEDLTFLETDLFDFLKIDGSNFSNCPKLQHICGDETELEAISRKISSYNYVNCTVGSYCSFTPGGVIYTIQGNNKLDSNNNGCDALDIAASNIKFTVTDGATTGTVISNETGAYSIKVKEGTYIITPVLENPSYFAISPASVNVAFPTETSLFTQDFCISPIASHKDLEITLMPLEAARPGFDVKYQIIYKNKGTNIQSGSVNLTFNDAVLDLVAAIPAISSQTTNNRSWDFTNLAPFETREISLTLNVNTPAETPAVNNGDILDYTASINSLETDEMPNDNTFTLNQTVVGSFDPNDKTCIEGDVITPALIGEYVHYQIRFENTGTYPAQNIVVKDLIDLSKFDISTLVPIKASHSYITKISEGNKVEFIFENINLPYDDATNDGYIAFKIKTKPTLVVGDSFENEANIYFDYNFPILTNKATSTFKTLGTSDFEFSNYFNVYPNPANEVLNIAATNTIEVKSISIYNILGQLVIAAPNAQTLSKVDVSRLTTGNYFIKMNTDKGSSSVKFIKN
jgi:Leucine-rich repeat (LRR) protein